MPTLFAHSKKAVPRTTRSASKAGYAPLPKTWFHVRHRLSLATRRVIKCLSTSARGRRAPDPVPAAVHLVEALRAGGHDYLRTILDPTEYSEDIKRVMVENASLREQIDTLNHQSLTINNLKTNDRLFQFFTNLPNFAVFDALHEYLENRVRSGKSQLLRWKGQKDFWKNSDEAAADSTSRADP